MAMVIMEFTKSNILSLASQAMLGQANLIPQGILGLLQ
jgi:flagellin